MKSKQLLKDIIEFSWFENNGNVFQDVINLDVTKTINVTKTIPCSDTINITKAIRINGFSNTVPTFEFSNSDNIGLYVKNANWSEFHNIYAKGARVGLYCNAHSCLISDCKFSYNKIGLVLKDAYITRVINSHITYNKIGVYAKGQSYETIISHNVIDNNEGGIGVIIDGTCSPIVKNNTIEGNRIVGTSGTQFGVGIVLGGYQLSTKIIDNWFELNGDTEDSVNVFAYLSTSLGITHQSYTDILNKIKSIISEYSDISSVTNVTLGTIELSNVNIFTANSYVLTGYQTNYCLHNNKYNGSEDYYSKSVVIYGRPSNSIQYDCNYVIYSDDINGSYKIDKGDNEKSIFINGNVKSLIVDFSKLNYKEINISELSSYKVPFKQDYLSGTNLVKYLAHSGYPFGDVYASPITTNLRDANGNSFVDSHRNCVLFAIYNIKNKEVYPFTYVRSDGSEGLYGTVNSDGYYGVLPEITDDVSAIYIGAYVEILALYAIPSSVFESNYNCKYIKPIYENNMYRIGHGNDYLESEIPTADSLYRGTVIYNVSKGRMQMTNGTSWVNLDGTELID